MVRHGNRFGDQLPAEFPFPSQGQEGSHEEKGVVSQGSAGGGGHDHAVLEGARGGGEVGWGVE